MIKAKNIQKYYDQLQVLKGVDIEINKGEIVAIVGASGAGKTTLLQILGTLDQPSKNPTTSLEINATNILTLSDKELSKFRNLNLGFIFQFHQLLPEFTALENVCIPAFIANKNKTEAETEAKRLLEYLGLGHRLNHKPNELSGGEQQRVAVARALINKPAVIFADEPSGNLDTNSAIHLHELFFKLRDEFNQTFVIVTHNEELANMADRKLFMVDGEIQRSEKKRNIEINTVEEKKQNQNDFYSEKPEKFLSSKKTGILLVIMGIGLLASGILGLKAGDKLSLYTAIPMTILGCINLIYGIKKIIK